MNCSLLTYSRQRISDEHIDHSGTAELSMHHDHPCRILAHLTDDLGVLAAFDATQGFEGGVSDFGGDYGEELAFVSDVEGVYAQDLTRPEHNIPDGKRLLPQRDTVARVTRKLVQHRTDAATRRVAHEAQALSGGI